jgi:hypothetical protein
MQTLQVGLSSWIIQDGNYEDFEVGREYRFALEFYAPHIAISKSQVDVSGLTPLGNAKYKGVGSVIYRSKKAWVIDVGVPAYRDEPAPAKARMGSRVEGELYIGIDPFFYFETLNALPGMPNLYRQWYIKRIMLETTPWLETVDDTGCTLRVRDDEKLSFVDVSATDAWNHDGGHGHYILECEQR